MKEDSIDRYLRGQNISAVNDKLSHAELEELSIIREGIRLSALQEKSLMLKNLEKEIASNDHQVSSKQSRGRIMNLNQVMAIAASLTLLIAAGLWFVNNSGSSTPDELYASHYEFPAALGVVRGSEAADDYNKALVTYNSKKFEDAISLLNQSDNPRAKFYMGISYLELDNPSSAIEQLTDYGLNPIGDLPYQYFLGLAYLKSGDIAQGKLTLQKIGESQGYWTEAQDIINQLN